MVSRNTLSRPYWLALSALTLLGTAVCSAQGTPATISIIAGDGQLIRQANISPQQLTVLVKDANGVPVPGTTVNWIVTSGAGSVSPTSVTDPNGLAMIPFVAPQVGGPYLSFTQSTITASLPTNNASVNFVETSYYFDLNNSVIYVIVTRLSPTLSIPLPPGTAGVPGTAPIQASVVAAIGSQAGTPIPHVALQILADNTSGPTITCQGGTAFTDATGTATCTPIFGGLGTGTFSTVVGGGFDPGTRQPLAQFVFLSQPFTVASGGPSMVTITSGNNISGGPGLASPTPLVAVVADAAGNPIPGVPVIFELETPGTAILTNVNSTSDSTGKVSASLTLGNTAGTYKIRVRSASTTGPAYSAEYTFTVTIPVGGLQKISGDTQNALISSGFSLPLVVQVNDTTGKGVAGAPVSFAITRGSGTLGTPSPATDSSGRASTTVAAGASAGPLTVVATSGTFTQTFSLTIMVPGPVITTNSFTNGASGLSGGLAPGAIATITGPGIAPNIQGSVTAPGLLGNLIQVQLAGVTVQFNGIYAPIYNVTNSGGQQSVTVQVPFEVAPGAANVMLTVNGVATTLGVTIQTYSPGIFEWVMADNVKRAVVVRPDGSVVNTNNPARRNETLRMFATGLGVVAPQVSTNQFDSIDMDPMVVAPVIVGVANGGVQVISATYARNLLGVYEVRFVIPDGTPSGANVPFAIAVQDANGNLIFGQPSAIPVQ
ncbi:MAG: Ig-like domain-containing protein [Acidobacteriota bacterium]|nr:Ig-like domain-containing protein [Acidobacteriota bacterium]